MNIINSDIVKSAYDVFWSELPEHIGALEPRPVLVLTHEMDQGGPVESQLMKMLDACEMDSEQYNIAALGEGKLVSWNRIREKLRPKFVFLIGILPEQLGVTALFRLHEPNRYNDVVWLPTFSIPQLEKYPEAKSHLWSAGMKPIFVEQQYGALVS